MNVGNSVRKAIDDWQQGELEAAMLHACNAIDGTAKKLYPNLGSNARFTRLLCENYSIFGPMGAPGIDLVRTRWPVRVAKPKAPGGKPDIADVIYGIHRCTHGHGDELPDGFDLIPNAAGPAGYTCMEIQNGRVRLSDRVIFGLLAVAVMAPVNHDQRVPDGYHLTLGGTDVMLINEWWGPAPVTFPLSRQNTPYPTSSSTLGNGPVDATPGWGSAPRIFGAQGHSDHSAAIHTLAALWHLSDDESRFKVRIVPIGKNTDLEIRVAQFDLRCLVIQPYNDGDRCLWRP